MKTRYMNFLIFKDVNSFSTHSFRRTVNSENKTRQQYKGSAESDKTCFGRESEKDLFFLKES
jgi:hypothetical protein